MDTRNDPKAKPPVDAGKAPYGHEDAPPLSFVPPAADAAPAIDLLGDGVEHAHTALNSFEDADVPIFPPANVGLANEDSAAPLMAPKPADPTEADDADAGRSEGRRGLRAFVRRHPVSAVLAAVAAGLLIARLSR